MKRLFSCLLVLALVSGCAGVKDAVNPYEENFRCKAKDSEGKCVDTPSAYRGARLPDGHWRGSGFIQAPAQVEARTTVTKRWPIFWKRLKPQRRVRPKYFGCCCRPTRGRTTNCS